MNVNEKFHYFTVLTLYYDKFAGILPKTMQKICICGGAILLEKRTKTVKRMYRRRIQRGDMAGIGSAP